jgi:SAM-dependent methyltransferase
VPRPAATAWITAARLRRKLRRESFDREQLVRRYAAGRSFADVGCMYGANGRIAFVAEEAGAEPVTAFDAMEETPEYLGEHARRGSAVRFVRGDLHDPGAIGEHDVVWCAGVIYHSPYPLLTLERLAAAAREVLIVGSHTIPEVPGLDQACVFYPKLGDAGRGVYRPVWPCNSVGIATPYDERPEMAYANYWWGITPSALRAMVEVQPGFQVVEEAGEPFLSYVVARRD